MKTGSLGHSAGITIFALTFLCVGLAGCGRFRDGKPLLPVREGAREEAPAVKVISLSAELSEGGAGEFRLGLFVAPPETRLSSVTHAEVELWLDGRYVAASALAMAEVVPEGGRALAVVLPVAFRGETSPQSQTVRARVEGRLVLRSEGSDDTYPFAGTLPLTARRLPLPDEGLHLE